MASVLQEGTIFANRYRVGRCVASGGMGAVYEAVHLDTARRRALKVMHPHLFQSEDLRDRFKREARITADIESEYLVDVSDAGVDDVTGMPFIVMEMLRGEDLGERLRRVGRLPPAETVTYLHQTALALVRTHAASIVHRDLKPANLFLTQREDGAARIKVLDFGVAKVVAEGATAAGVTDMLGTPLYMAPEQFHAGAKLTSAADIYALGMLAYSLLVGEPYWRQEASSAGDVIAFALVAHHGPRESAVQRASRSGVSLPPGFDTWFVRVTAANPAARFHSAVEAVQALAEVLGVAAGGLLPAATSSPVLADAATPPPTPAVPPASDRTVSLRGAPVALPLEGAKAEVDASTPPTPAKSRRGRLLISAALAGSVGLGLAAWTALRSGRGSSEDLADSARLAAPPSTAAVALDTTAAPATSAPALTSISPSSPSAAASAPVASTRQDVGFSTAIRSPEPRASAPPAPPALVGASARSKAGAESAAGSTVPAPPVSSIPLLGRD